MCDDESDGMKYSWRITQLRSGGKHSLMWLRMAIETKENKVWKQKKKKRNREDCTYKLTNNITNVGMQSLANTQVQSLIAGRSILHSGR